MDCLETLTRSTVDQRIANKADEDIKHLLQPLKGHPVEQEAASILLDFQRMVFNGKGSDALTILQKHGDVPGTMDEYIAQYTRMEYNSVESLIKSAASNSRALAHLRNIGYVANATMDKMAAYRTDFSEYQQDSKVSDFLRVYNILVRKQQGTMVGSYILGNRYLRDYAKVVLSNQGPLHYNDKQLMELSIRETGINSGIKTFNNELEIQMNKLYEKRLVKGYVNSNDLDTFMHKTNGKNYNESLTIAKELAKEIYDSPKHGNPNKLSEESVIDTISNAMINFKKDFDMLNFGYDMTKLEEETKGMTPDEKNTYRQKILGDINNLTKTTLDDGTGMPPIYFQILNTGREIADLIHIKKYLKMDIEDIEEQWYRKFNREDGDFHAFTYYVPSELHDMLGAGSFSGTSEALAKMPPFLKKRQLISDEGDKALDVLVGNNMKVFQNTVEKLSTYAALTLKDKVIQDRFDNGLVPESLTNEFKIIQFEAQKRLEGLTADSIDKQYRRQIVLAKAVSSAYTSVVAGGLLLAGWFNNMVGGGIGILSTFGLKDATRIIGQYSKALKSNDPVDRQVRDMVDFRLKYITAISDKTDMILKSEKFTGDIEGAIEQSTKIINAAGDLMLSKGLLGWIPILKYTAFNQSEHFISKIQNAVLYDRALTYCKSAVEHGGVKLTEEGPSGKQRISEDFQRVFDRAMELFEPEARQKGYEAIGQFDSNAKPSIFHYAKNATSLTGVITGTYITLWSMFKQVEHVNYNLLLRTASPILQKNNFTSLKTLKANAASAFGTGAMSGAVGMMILSFYEWLADKYDFIPQLYGAYNANPTKLTQQQAGAAWAFHNLMTGEPASDEQIKSAGDVMSFAVGVGLGSTATGLTMKMFEDANPLSPLIQKWKEAQDIEANIFKLTLESVEPFDNITDVMTWRHDIDLVNKKTVYTDASVNNISNYPFVSVVPVIGSNNKVSSIIKDVAKLVNDAIMSSTLPEEDHARIQKNIKNDIGKTFVDLSGITLYMPPDVVQYQNYYEHSKALRLLRKEAEYQLNDDYQTHDFYKTARYKRERITTIPNRDLYKLTHPGSQKLYPTPYRKK